MSVAESTGLRWSRLFFILLLAAAVAQASCAKKEDPKKKKEKPPTPVLVAMAAKKDMPVRLTAIGNVEAFSTVGVKSQVTGEVRSVSFKEGQDVRRGALLFTVDARQLETELKRAEGVLSKDRVQAANADADAARYAELLKRGIVSKQQSEQAATAAGMMQEVINSDKAAIETIKVQLSYSKIYAPLDGRTGGIAVNRGNIVKANDVDMVVINQIMPIYVTFSLPEAALPQLQRLMKAGKVGVSARINGDTAPPTQGVLSFIDNAVDMATGSIKLKATFANRDRKLWPGQFVDVVVELAPIKNAVVLPTAAVQTGQKGQYVYIVKPDNTAELRPVTVGLSQEGETVIEAGISPGEPVVIDGQMKLAPGGKVDIKKDLNPAPARADKEKDGAKAAGEPK